MEVARQACRTLMKFRTISIVLVLLVVCGCRKANHGLGGPPEGAPGGEMPPTEVGIVTVAPEVVGVTVELPGRVSSIRIAEVRARATGILMKRLFEEGADVQADQVLFEIDPAPLQASYDSVKANLARAEAILERAQADARRKEGLVKINGVSQQVYEEAKATALQSEADVLAAKAALQTAALNLGYTKVTAPISGRIGKSLVTEGALLSATEATKLTTIQQLDSVYVDFTQSTTEMLRFRRLIEGGKAQGAKPGEACVTLLLEDGTLYSRAGKLLFADVTVDETTGSVGLRASVANPDKFLLPGMFVRGRVELGKNAQALTVPQRAVSRDPTGQANVLVVNSQNQVESKLIQTEGVFGDKWIVSSGLKAGERVVVEGLQKVRAGATVVPTPFQSASTNSMPVSATVSTR
jgi:membrane fusion protein, multidrug efflux system